ncbi:MAG: HIT family protein [Flavobacteriales bacterium]|nr:HIT family protein [Flavobacteriales bacterium]
MASVFTKIINGELPSYKVAEDENYIAILDAFPIIKGHVLVIPKQEVDKIYELDEKTYAGLMLFARRVARAVEKAIPCKRVGYSVVGLDVHHVHVHLLPLNGPKDMDLSRPTMTLPKEEMTEIAKAIASQLDK